MYKKIFIFIVLGIALFLASPVFAQDNLVVEFEKTPLFDEANFLPGQSVSRWVKVTNNSGQSQRIAAEAINITDPDRFGDVLTLEIKEAGTTLYSKPLSAFFNAGEEFLSNLANSSTTTYDFSVSFYPGAQNKFQGKTLGFDILIGFQGEEGGILPGAGGGGGGYLPPGLTISEEDIKITELSQTSVTITWLTSYSSTSQVIYAKNGEPHTLDLTDYTGTPPKYGYARTTPEQDFSSKVTFHSVTISGLDSETKYYFRCISHASLAISIEHSFTTLGFGIGEQEEEEEEEEEEEIGPGKVIGEQEEEEEEEEEGGIGWLEEPELEETETKEKTGGLAWLLAAIGDLLKIENLWWLLLLVLIIIFFLILLSRRKRKSEEEKS